jgi:hypothetical protein
MTRQRCRLNKSPSIKDLVNPEWRTEQLETGDTYGQNKNGHNTDLLIQVYSFYSDISIPLFSIIQLLSV